MKTKYEKSRSHEYAEKWFLKNGYKIIEVKQLISKTIFVIEKDDVSIDIDIYNNAINIESYMKSIKNLIDLKMNFLKSN